MSILGDLATLARSGILRPLGPRTTFEVTRQFLREGIRQHLIYTLYAARHPHKPAVVFEEHVTTWRGLLDRIQRLSNHLISTGIGPGSSVAIMLPNRPEFIEANAAGIRVGAVVSFVNPRAPAADAKSLFDRTGADVVVTHRDDLGAGTPVLRIGGDYEHAIAHASDVEPRVDRAARGKLVAFTSGTTGRPKGAVRSLEGASIGSVTGFLKMIPFRTSDVHLVVSPMYHSLGSGFATVAQALGNTMVIVEKFSPEAFCRNVQEHKVTTTAVVPTMLHQLASWPDAKNFDLKTLRLVLCGGAALREEVRSQARELLGDVIYDLYGATEMGFVSIATPDDLVRKPTSVGKPVPGIEVRIADAHGNEVPRGERGEIWARSSLGMEDYLDDPELGAERMREGFISVRDVGYLDEDGYLHVVDRADDMIISGGVNVYPAETEIALNAHPKVDEASVLGVPDPKWGERIVAVVVRSGDVTEDELISWAKENIEYAAVPKEIRFMESLPRNDIGKVDKKKLAATFGNGS
ncbi:MAG TPA: AMP-binding protein [Actinomycetota bacterium]|nr:AMP-binding protein [Actinomycetota bacterium]